MALAPSRRDATGRERPRRRTFTAKESSVPLDGSPALIYLHATRERDQRIAAGMGQLFKDATAARQAGTKSRTQARNGHAAGNVTVDGRK